MKIVRNRKDLINYLNNIRINNQVGLVPTMGSIHQGHLSLINQSVKNKYITCVNKFNTCDKSCTFFKFYFL